MAAALADGGQRNEVREYGKIAATPAAMKVLPALSASSTDRMSLLYACPDGMEGTERLCCRLARAGKPLTVVTTALARELAGLETHPKAGHAARVAQ